MNCNLGCSNTFGRLRVYIYIMTSFPVFGVKNHIKPYNSNLNKAKNLKL